MESPWKVYTSLYLLLISIGFVSIVGKKTPSSRRAAFHFDESLITSGCCRSSSPPETVLSPSTPISHLNCRDRVGFLPSSRRLSIGFGMLFSSSSQGMPASSSISRRRAVQCGAEGEERGNRRGKKIRK
ncbi:hypothetical protein KSP40_PGU022356 [Platanthera guangdongensis]|uniref:Uncharacterized protein n=1 Tax=Platanthera guangdongensis TaxID=2320717 RepID=A0ABR2MQY7_9ASPA